MFTCKKCHRELNESEFFKSKNTKSGYRGSCKRCAKEENDRYNASHRQQRLQYSRDYEAKNTEVRYVQQRGHMLHRLYNIGIDEWNKIFDSQDKKCAICQTDNPGKQNWRTDHDHNTGLVRGILCHSCNIALGLMDDNPICLSSAASYIPLTGAPSCKNSLDSHIMIRDDPNHSYADDPQAASRMYLYGITKRDWYNLFHMQGDGCAICGRYEPTSKGWHTDHRHDTGNIRGILCSNCNTSLGLLSDSPSLFRSAVEYVSDKKIKASA